MMRNALLALLLLLPLPALAHVGHLDEVDGHSHYLAAWALLGVIAGSVWLIWTERRAPKTPKAKARKDGADA
jgi:cyanate permease